MDMSESWLEYWNGDVSLYVSPGHLAAHYRGLFAEVAPLLPPAPFTLLDYGCGEALMAPAIAGRGGRVLLYDRADARRDVLRRRFADKAGVEVLDDLETVRDSCDVVLLISVIQYVPKDELPALLADLRRLLKPGGLLLVGDILDPDGGMIDDALALLRFAWAEGFFVDALFGLAKTLVSDYRKVRGRIGLSAYVLEEILKVLEAAGFAARPLARNIGHARHRRSVAARRTE